MDGELITYTDYAIEAAGGPDLRADEYILAGQDRAQFLIGEYGTIPEWTYDGTMHTFEEWQTLMHDGDDEDGE